MGTSRLRLIAVTIIAVASLSAVLLLTACGSSGDTGTTTTSDEPTVMVYAVPWTMYTSLDPGAEYWNNVYHHEVYETLADNDPTAPELVKPRLAESWESSEGGKVWTFHLRKGVKFHGGDDFTSADVIFSFDRNRELAAGAYNFLYDGIESWEAVDDYTVVIRCSAPRPVAAISAACNNGFIYSKAAFEKDGEKCFEPGTETAGSGPYTVKSVTTTEVTYERFPGYWGGWEGTHAQAPDVVVMRKVEEAAVRIQQLQTGDAQIVAGIPVNAVEDLKSDPNVKFASGPWWRSSYIFLNTKSQATKDIHLREALFYAFPYEQAKDLAYEGMADLASGVINQSQPGDQLQNDTVGVPKQDMAKAKAALAKSAYPNGGVKLLLRVDAGMEDNMKCAQLFKAALQELNIELDVRYIASDVAYKEALSDNPPQAGYMVEWSAFYPGVANYGQMWLRSDSAYNLTYYKNPEIDKLLSQALEAEATDVMKAAESVVQASKIARDAYSYVWVAGSPHWRVGMAKNVTWGGYMPTDAYTVYFYDVQMN
jgi:peptide/nickel transport system substrate-binding protein